MKKEIIKKTNFKCLSPSLTREKIKKWQETFDKNQGLEDNVGLAEILGGQMRSRILYLLGKENWLSVCDIADILRSSVSATSHQLGILRVEKLVKTKRRNRLVLYNLAEKLPAMAELLVRS